MAEQSRIRRFFLTPFSHFPSVFYAEKCLVLLSPRAAQWTKDRSKFAAAYAKWMQLGQNDPAGTFFHYCQGDLRVLLLLLVLSDQPALDYVVKTASDAAQDPEASDELPKGLLDNSRPRKPVIKVLLTWCKPASRPGRREVLTGCIGLVADQCPRATWITVHSRVC